MKKYFEFEIFAVCTMGRWYTLIFRGNKCVESNTFGFNNRGTALLHGETIIDSYREGRGGYNLRAR